MGPRGLQQRLRGHPEDRVGGAGGGPHLCEHQQIGIDEDCQRLAVTKRWDPADGKAGPLPDLVGVGPGDAPAAGRGGQLLLVELIVTKFSVGARARLTRGGVGSPAGDVSVVQALPKEAGPQQYRVRADGETFERVIEEGRLEAVSYD